MPPTQPQSKLFAVTIGFGAFAVLISLIAMGVGIRAFDGGSGETDVVAGDPMTVEIELGDLYVKPSSIEVPAGTPLTLVVTNNGAMPHDLKLQGGETGTPMLDPGASYEADMGVMTETTQAWCTVPGHREAGMELTIAVSGTTTEVAAGGHASGDHGTGAAPASDAAEIDFTAAPGPDWEPYDPRLQPAPGGTVHDMTLRATEKVIEVAPGVTQELWTFNDTVPGPVLRGKVGDVFNLTIVNEGKMGHSIDFHASKVAWNDEMRTIEPGESLVYQFEAKHAGIFMYHCGTAPTLHHIGNGMHGTIIIDPPDLPAVDHEVVFVQSELYLGPEGKPGDLTKMVDEDWDAVVFNGYVNQYVHAPIRVEQGERVRAWIVDNGPSENSSWHVVGTVFDTVFKEGSYLLRPDASRGGSQALDLQPAQGGFVEFTFDEDGLYPFVTHKFANAGKGAQGFFQVGDVEMPAGGH